MSKVEPTAAEEALMVASMKHDFERRYTLPDDVRRAVMIAQGCGKMRGGQHVYCDHCECEEIAQAALTAFGLLDENKALREALEAVRRDLIIRAGGYPGEKEAVVVNLSNGVWMQLNDALENSQQGEG